MNKTGLAYKPVGLLLGVAAGAAAGVAFQRLWAVLPGRVDAPEPLDEDRGWGEILLAAALQGVVFSVVRAAVNRGGAVGVRRLTGHWPA